MSAEEEMYSVIFSALKHPIRRRILRMLAEQPQSFTNMLTVFRIESSHLTYHLEQLRELIFKTSQGNYQLSGFGYTAYNTMQSIEGPPRRKHAFNATLLYRSWKPVFVILILGLLALSVGYYVQSQSFNELTTQLHQLSLNYHTIQERMRGVRNDVSLHREYTLDEQVEFDVRTLSMREIGSSNSVFYNLMANTTLHLQFITLPLLSSLSDEFMWLSVQEGNAFDSASKTASVIWNVNATTSTLYSIPLQREGWYTISFHGPITPERDKEGNRIGLTEYPVSFGLEQSWQCRILLTMTISIGDEGVLFLVKSQA